MKLSIAFASALALAACGGAPVAIQTPGGGTTNDGAGSVGTIALKNASDYDIYSIQLAPFDRAAWGGNLIQGDVLMRGESAQLAVFDCRKYDLRMVDDENVECVIQDIDLCFENKSWTIDDSVLSGCATGWAD